MTKSNKLFITIVAVVLITVSAVAMPKTLTGTVTDTMCGKKHMIAGKSAAECTRECMKSKGNWTYGLVVGDKVYGLTGDSHKFETLAGQRVNVTGEQSGNRVTVQTINPAQ